MSNVATRSRKTVPLEASSNDGSSHRSHSMRSTRSESGDDAAGSRPRRTSSLRIDRQQNRPSMADSENGHGSGSSHTHGSYDSRASSMVESIISTEELRKSRAQKKSGSRSHRHHNTPTSSNASDRLTIGHSSGLGSSRGFLAPSNGSVTSSDPDTHTMSALPDLFSLEQAFTDCGDDSRRVERIFSQTTANNTKRGGDGSGRSQRSQSLSGTPITWKTPFEVDAPRDPFTPSGTQSSGTYHHLDRPHSPSSTFVSEPPIIDPRLSEEQNAWAGIDALLETRSLDDSFAFSTTDILPSSTVRAMRKDGSFRSLDASVLNDDDDRSEYSASYQVLRRLKEMADKKEQKFERGMPSLVEASDHEESDSRAGAAAGGSGGGIVENQEPQISGGNLFSVFHWSEKQNVDEIRGRKKKLNQTRKVKLQFGTPPTSQHGSDTASLPSLASFRDDDFSTRSEISDWNSIHEKGSVLSADLRSMKKERSSQRSIETPPAHFEGADTPHETMPDQSDFFVTVSHSTLVTAPPTPLMLDRQVDEYIRRIQEQLPTIAEHGSPSKRGKKSSLAVIVENNPCPVQSNAFADDSSVWDELPSLASLSSLKMGGDEGTGAVSAAARRKEKKKDPSQSVSSQLMGSIKRIGTKRGNAKSTTKGQIQGDEEKYFPDADKQKNLQKNFKANRCLLKAGGDGVNWDAD